MAFQITQNVIDEALSNYLITCRNVMFKELPLVEKEAMEIIPLEQALQLIYEGVIIREFVIGNVEILCYFERNPYVILSNNECRMLRSYHSTIMCKRDFPNESN